MAMPQLSQEAGCAQPFLRRECGRARGGRSRRCRAAGPFPGTYFTLVLVQMMYSISSEYGFWKVKELVRIQSHSRFLDRKRNMTDKTWPFNFTTCKNG